MHQVVSIVACGPSARKCKAEAAPGYVIAVNDAYRHVRHDAVLSMDGRWARNRIPEMNVGTQPIYLRRSAWNHVPENIPPRTAERVRVFNCSPNQYLFGELADRDFILNGPNSGFCALNLAYQMKPETIYLFGFDHSGGHFHPESEWALRGEGCRNSDYKFSKWLPYYTPARAQFDAAGITVFNTNRHSRIRAFEFASSP